MADIAHIRILKELYYLMAQSDRCSRKVIGWTIFKRISGELCLASRKSAMDKRNRWADIFIVQTAV